MTTITIGFYDRVKGSVKNGTVLSESLGFPAVGDFPVFRSGSGQVAEGFRALLLGPGFTWRKGRRLMVFSLIIFLLNRLPPEFEKQAIENLLIGQNEIGSLDGISLIRGE